MPFVRALILFASVLSFASSFAQTNVPAAKANPNNHPSADAALSPAGTIDLVDGVVRIIQTGKSPRPAVVRDAVYEGDILVTGKDSEVHVTMLDSGFIALRANSRFRILRYKADGGDDDTGIFRLVEGAMRSITGWIGKYNRKSYLVRTPTATIGVRGTDHETRYIPPGSSEGEPGTYDKVFAGGTLIQTDAGTADVTADQAGYVPDNAGQRPRVLSSIPGFFRPGPHEDVINKKHADIQQTIEQRREERRKIIEEKRTALDLARKNMQEQVERNKATAEEKAAAAEKQHQETDVLVAAINNREKALQEKQKGIRDMRKAIQEKIAGEVAGSSGLRKRMKVVRENFNSIRQGYKYIQGSRKALNAENLAATEARTAAAEAQRRRNEEQLAAMGERWRVLKEKFQAIQDMNQAIQEAASDPRRKGKPDDQRLAVRTATDAANKEQRDNLDAQNVFFENNIAATEARLMAAKEERRQTEQKLDEMSAKEEALRVTQQQTEAEFEAIHAAAVEQGHIAGVREQIQSMHEAAEVASNERKEIQRARLSLRVKNMVAVEERAHAAMTQLKAVREKHRDVQDKSVDLQNEREIMQEEIRTLYEQEQTRYREELRADRLQGAIQNASGDIGQGP